MDVKMHTFIPVKHPRFSQTSKITGQRPLSLLLLTAATLLAVMSVQLSSNVVSPNVTSLNEDAIGVVPMPTPKPSKAEIAAILAARDAQCIGNRHHRNATDCQPINVATADKRARIMRARALKLSKDFPNERTDELPSSSL